MYRSSDHQKRQLQIREKVHTGRGKDKTSVRSRLLSIVYFSSHRSFIYSSLFLLSCSSSIISSVFFSSFPSISFFHFSLYHDSGCGSSFKKFSFLLFRLSAPLFSLVYQFLSSLSLLLLSSCTCSALALILVVALRDS